MSDVLIRNVPPEDLERIRAAAARRGTSLQNYLREVMHAQAAYLRRHDVLATTAERLRGHPEVSEEERRAVLDAVADAHDERSGRLSDWPRS